MSTASTTFSATGTIQSFSVPADGSYAIEASGAQGGPGGGPGGKGARVRGTFRLSRGDRLWIVVGQQGGPGTTPHQSAGGGGGGTFVWKCQTDLILPSKPLLAAGGGGGEGSDGCIEMNGANGAAPGGRDGQGGAAHTANFQYSGGGGVGWASSGATGSTPTYCGGGSRWAGGAGANYCCNIGGMGGFGGGGGGSFLGHGSGGGGGYSGGGGGTQAGPGGGGGGSYNAGVNQTNLAGVQTGDGAVTIVAVPDSAATDHAGAEQPCRVVSLENRALETASRGGRGPDSENTFRGYF